MSGIMTCFLHRDEAGWYAITEWDDEPIVFRLPDDYDPLDDKAEQVFQMLGQILTERSNGGGSPP